MGTFQSFRKAYGALKDSTKVGLIKVNSEFKVPRRKKKNEEEANLIDGFCFLSSVNV